MPWMLFAYSSVMGSKWVVSGGPAGAARAEPVPDADLSRVLAADRIISRGPVGAHRFYSY